MKSLTITRGDGAIIRDIRFHTGLNLIVDETPGVSGKETGNNVGKTTVLKLVDFCLGTKAREIYSDIENKRNEYKLVKEFLIGKKVNVSLVLKDDLLQEESREVLIERNFLVRKDKIQRIDGSNKTDDENELEKKQGLKMIENEGRLDELINYYKEENRITEAAELCKLSGKLKDAAAMNERAGMPEKAAEIYASMTYENNVPPQQTIKVCRCPNPNCGEEIKPHWNQCPVCGTELKENRCDCGEELGSHWNLCPACGKKLKQ